jgi:DNA mismatch endonuclease (patch repair protein)
MMAAVRNKNSKAELALRRALHARGLRFRLHAKDLPGRPDIVLPRHRLAVFVDGDLWHGNAWRLRGLDRLEDLFPTHTDWWVAKIRRTMERDSQVTVALTAGGWTVVRLWESDVLADPDKSADLVIDRPIGKGHEFRRPHRKALEPRGMSHQQ